MTRTSIFAWLGLLAIPVLLICGAAKAANAPPAEKKPAEASDKERESLEKKFAETMSGVVLTGHYTMGEMKADYKPKEEHYEISKVTKLTGDTWLFNVSIKYGEHDATLPLPLEVKWAGDTPVITLTKAAVPGFGTFSARVLFYEGSYAGTWSASDHGGTLFGSYAKKAAEPAKATEKKDDKKTTDK